MDYDYIKILKEKGLCCISRRSLATSKHINMILLDYVPNWEFPYEANLLFPDQPKRAIAYIHDDQVIVGRGYMVPGKIRFAVEFKDGKIIYHSVKDLKPIRYYEEG